MASFAIDDDKDLDDAALWAVIDSAAAAAAASRITAPTATSTITTNNFASRKPLTLRCTNVRNSPHVHLPPSPSPSPPSSHQKLPQNPRHYTLNSSIKVPTSNRANWDEYNRPHKVIRSDMSENSPDMVVVKRVPTTPAFLSPEIGSFPTEKISPMTEYQDNKEKFTHCLSGRFPTVSLFKDYQDAALAILEKSDYAMISGNPFIKKSGWRKIAFYFNISFEIKDKTIEFDDNHNVHRAEFVVRAYMQGGRFSDGWGSCERREKKFNKPNNDIPSTAETRAKNKACQDLVGIGAYRSGVGNSHSSR